MTVLSTIGYEGAALADFIATLKIAGILQVIDIRDVPVSRRPGFSKRVLAQALDEAGITYLHLKPLGDPKPGREAAREGRFDAFRLIYGSHLEQPDGQTALKEAASRAEKTPSVLLCYERDHKHCHRTIVANAISALNSCEIRHLGVQKVLSTSRMGKDAVGNHGAVTNALC